MKKHNETKEVDAIEIYRTKGGPLGYYWKVVLIYEDASKGRDDMERIPELSGATEISRIKKILSEKYGVRSKSIYYELQN
mgnify:CR=1 FL=1